jgi:hypothetical protein
MRTVIIEALRCASSRRRILGCLAMGHIIELTVASQSNTRLIIKVDAEADQEQPKIGI